ncbi:MAG: CDP-diacylglycerol--serine O-phosphatidyltransferase [Nitrospinota bacterium]|nr:MAG: CDP-diacylglycerol--serine O-phosphatidyltransferase [Nitrospinota bacterium]
MLSDKIRLEKGKYLLPSLMTTANIFCGFYGIIAAVSGRFYQASFAVLVAVVFDFFDGRIARWTNSTSDFGIEYDSLADLLSFGVAPGLLLYAWTLQSLGKVGWLATFFFIIGGALRLARFNVQAGEDGSFDFTGLPIPAAAGLIASLVILGREFIVLENLHPLVIVLLTCLLTVLMVSKIRYRSLKHIELRHKKPLLVVVTLLLSLYVLTSIPELALFLTFLLYAFSGPFEQVFFRQRYRTASALDMEEDF